MSNRTNTDSSSLFSATHCYYWQHTMWEYANVYQYLETIHEMSYSKISLLLCFILISVPVLISCRYHGRQSAGLSRSRHGFFSPPTTSSNYSAETTTLAWLQWNECTEIADLTLCCKSNLVLIDSARFTKLMHSCSRRAYYSTVQYYLHYIQKLNKDGINPLNESEFGNDKSGMEEVTLAELPACERLTNSSNTYNLTCHTKYEISWPPDSLIY